MGRGFRETYINEAEPGFCWGKKIEKTLGNMLEKTITTTKMKPQITNKKRQFVNPFVEVLNSLVIQFW